MIQCAIFLNIFCWKIFYTRLEIKSSSVVLQSNIQMTDTTIVSNDTIFLEATGFFFKERKIKYLGCLEKYQSFNYSFPVHNSTADTLHVIQKCHAGECYPASNNELRNIRPNQTLWVTSRCSKMKHTRYRTISLQDENRVVVVAIQYDGGD
ncbi:MAG: hypothetical protein RL757_2744 [Bacteroidota bacterium]